MAAACDVIYFAIVTNGIDCCKWHQLFQMASTVANGIHCCKWHQLLQMASTVATSIDPLQIASTVVNGINCWKMATTVYNREKGVVDEAIFLFVNGRYRLIWNSRCHLEQQPIVVFMKKPKNDCGNATNTNPDPNPNPNQS